MSSGPGFYETSKYRCLVGPQKISDELYLLLCGVETCLPGYEFHTDGRAGYHLHVILSGKGVLSVNGTQSPLHFGQMFMTKPGEDSWYRADESDPWTYCWMAYDGLNAQRYSAAAGFSPGVNWLNCNLEPSLFYAVVKRVLDKPELNLASNLLRAGLLSEFLALAIRSEYLSVSSVRREQDYSADVYVDYAVNYINANFATAKISDVANYIGVHRSYLTSIFKNKMGISPQEYLMQCRMKTACALLEETCLSVQEVGQRIGYDNSLTFSKVFKTYYGDSPKYYRQKRQKAAAPDERPPEDDQNKRDQT